MTNATLIPSLEVDSFEFKIQGETSKSLSFDISKSCAEERITLSHFAEKSQQCVNLEINSYSPNRLQFLPNLRFERHPRHRHSHPAQPLR